jgi:glycosyltransferase involved in cell wall biosynthesis
VIVVDDRSTDGTNDILQRLAAEDARVRVVRVAALPDGWLGKCHACYLGAGAATGEWILFTDADCWLKPDVIARALEVAQRDAADHITLSPGVVPETPAARAVHLLFLIGLANWLSGVNRDLPSSHLGIGAFNLVRTEAYRQCGGYEALRLTVVDDIKLGLLLRRAGKRTRAFIGGDDAECHWGTTAGSIVRIMEKNYFAILDYRLGAAMAAGVGGMLLWCAAIFGPLTGTWAGMAAGLALLSLILPAYVCAKRLRWSFVGAMLAPFVYPLLLYAILNSTWVTIRQGGVRWRDTFYPLEALRKGDVR